jgi:FMN phosphatase YigB (HAD superfamily)
MALEERHELALQTSDVLYVGDMASDREAAERAGIDFCFAGDFFGWGDPEPTALDAARSQFAAGDAPEEEDREHGKSFPAEEGLR